MDFNFAQNIVLEDERALLRPLTIDDLDKLLPPATSDINLLQYSPRPVYNRDLLALYIEDALQSKNKQERYPFIIFDKQLNAWAGSSSFLYVTNFHQRLEIGATWYGKQFQRSGLNRHCKFLMLSYAFDTLGFERVEFKTDERNNASRTAIQKIGGQPEGILRSHTVMYDGFRRNTVCYSILKSEWPEVKSRYFFFK